MSKLVRYTLAVLACIVCYAVCIALMVATGIGGVIAMVLMCFAIKNVWNGIVHYGREYELYKYAKELELEQQPKEDSQES